MIKVLIIIGVLRIGGAEKVARDIGFFADKRKFEIHYIVYGDEIGSYEKELEQVGCKIFHFDPPKKNHINYYLRLKKLIQDEKYDVIHSHTMFSSAWPILAARQCGVKIRIAHSHTIRGFEKRGFIKNTYENIMREVIKSNSTHFIGCGQSAGEWLFGKKFFLKHGTIIYNGIDLIKFRYNPLNSERIRKQYRIESSFLIGNVGHLATVKNQSFLIQLMPILLKRNPNTALFIIGDGANRQILEQLRDELHLENKVFFTGNVQNVPDFLSAMDVFTFPSLYEGMPLALIEAQTNGLPCIISDKIPKDVFLTDLVHCISLKDLEKWIDAIVNAKRNDPDLYYQKMYDLGFDTSVMLEKIYRLYEGE